LKCADLRKKNAADPETDAAFFVVNNYLDYCRLPQRATAGSADAHFQPLLSSLPLQA
jgi:hypothetical protein